MLKSKGVSTVNCQNCWSCHWCLGCLSCLCHCLCLCHCQVAKIFRNFSISRIVMSVINATSLWDCLCLCLCPKGQESLKMHFSNCICQIVFVKMYLSKCIFSCLSISLVGCLKDQKILHSKVRKFATKIASRQNSVNFDKNYFAAKMAQIVGKMAHCV